MNKIEERKPLSKLKAVRKSKKMSMRKLGELVGCDRQTIYRYEAGLRSPSIPTIQKLAEALDVNINEII